MARVTAGRTLSGGGVGAATDGGCGGRPAIRWPPGAAVGSGDGGAWRTGGGGGGAGATALRAATGVGFVTSSTTSSSGMGSYACISESAAVCAYSRIGRQGWARAPPLTCNTPCITRPCTTINAAEAYTANGAAVMKRQHARHSTSRAVPDQARTCRETRRTPILLTDSAAVSLVSCASRASKASWLRRRSWICSTQGLMGRMRL